MPLHTGYIVQLRRLAMGRTWTKWCCGCVAELGSEWKAVGGGARGGESGRESGGWRAMLPLPDEKFTG